MSDISKFECRAIIKFLSLEKQLTNNIHERLVSVYGDSTPSYANVTRWVAEFKCGRKGHWIWTALRWSSINSYADLYDDTY